MTLRLNLTTLQQLSSDVAPRVDPGALRVGIVHLGIGAFHRAHQAVYTEDAIAAQGGEWGICGVTQRSPAVVEQYLDGRTIEDFRPRHLRVVGARDVGLDPEEQATLSLLRSWRIRSSRAAA